MTAHHAKARLLFKESLEQEHMRYQLYDLISLIERAGLIIRGRQKLIDRTIEAAKHDLTTPIDITLHAVITGFAYRGEFALYVYEEGSKALKEALVNNFGYDNGMFLYLLCKPLEHETVAFHSSDIERKLTRAGIVISNRDYFRAVFYAQNKQDVFFLLDIAETSQAHAGPVVFFFNKKRERMIYLLKKVGLFNADRDCRRFLEGCYV